MSKIKPPDVLSARMHCAACGADVEAITIWRDCLTGFWHLFVACHGAVDHVPLSPEFLRHMMGENAVPPTAPYTLPDMRFVDITGDGGWAARLPPITFFIRHTGEVAALALVRQAVQRFQELVAHAFSTDNKWPGAWAFLSKDRVMDKSRVTMPRVRRMDYQNDQPTDSAPGAKRPPRRMEEQP